MHEKSCLSRSSFFDAEAEGLEPSTKVLETHVCGRIAR